MADVFHLYVVNGRMGFAMAYILLFYRNPKHNTAKNEAGKVQIYLYFISFFLFLGGDDNVQLFCDFGRILFANLQVA